jgi:hypothetical protein
MLNSASQAAIFYREVAETRALWTIRDKDGFPAPLTAEGIRSQPFWSSQTRAQRIIDQVASYVGFSVHEISWPDFEARWVPGLTKDAILVGVNWSGPRATGYDAQAVQVRDNVQAQIAARGS